MDLLVRPARPEDAAAPLLFESAKPYYTAYAGSERGALKLLGRVWAHRGHAASFEFCRVATTPHGELIGVVAGFPVRDGDRLSRRFIRLTLPRVAPWRLHRTFAHLYAAGGVAPQPPLDAYYVDALAVDLRYRRRGIAQRLLDVAQDEAAHAGGSRSTPACRTARPVRSMTPTASGSARSAAHPATAWPRP